MLHWTTPAREPLNVAGASFGVAHVEVDEGVELRVMRWRPARAADDLPLVFVAGWVSSIEGWVGLLARLAESRTLYYVETREKRSARISRSDLAVEDFSVERMGADLVSLASKLELERPPLLIGCSLGASAVLEALKGGRLRAAGAFLIGPNTHFEFPWWGRAFVSAPASSFLALKWVAIFYLRYFRVDRKREPEQIARYERTLHSAIPIRIKRSAQAIIDYEVWPGVETIEVPLGVAFAASDRLHRADEYDRLIASVGRARLYTCPSNLFMHRAELADSVESFIGGLELLEPR